MDEARKHLRACLASMTLELLDVLDASSDREPNRS